MQAMRTGKHLGVSRPIMPPMPWQAIGQLPDSDLRAIYAYLQSQPAVKNKVPEYAPPANATAKTSGGRTLAEQSDGMIRSRTKPLSFRRPDTVPGPQQETQ